MKNKKEQEKERLRAKFAKDEIMAFT